MASQAQIERRKAILRARGVPERFVGNIARRRGTIVPLIFLFACWALLMATILSAITLEDPIIAALAPFLYPHARDSLLFYPPSSFVAVLVYGGVTLIIIVIFSYRLIFGRRTTKPFPAYDPHAESLRRLGSGEDLTAIRPDENYRALGDLADDAAFLERTRPVRPAVKGQWWWPIVLLPLVLPAALSGVEAAAYKTATLDAVHIYRPSRTATYRLADARFAYAVCYDEASSARFDYRLSYPGVTIVLWEYRDPIHHLDAAGVIDRLDRIDRRLAELHVPIHRMPSTGSPADDGNACIARLAQRWRLKDSATLRRLVFG